ncbi:MAG: Ig-like domain repeat protein [Anaerolineales bacterium]|nr:Ig-like domain repeat protein [Anaerolineales bacterium]
MKLYSNGSGSKKTPWGKIIRGLLICTLGVALLGIPHSSVLAQGAWAENFDSYLLNSQLHGIGGWKGWDNNPVYGAFVSNTQQRSSPHSVEITGNADLVHEYSGHTSGEWVYTAWQYIPAAYSGEGYFILLNTYNDSGSKNWSVQVHFRSSTNRVISDYDNSQLPMVRGRWVELRVEIDLDSDLQTFYYDGQILYQNKSWRSGVSGTGQAAIEAVDLYANNSTPIYFDDLSLKSASSTVLSSSANPSELGSDVLLTATVSSLSALIVTPGGTVDFYEGAVLIGSSPVNPSGQASITFSGLSLGPHTITANYNGDVNYATSSGSFTQTVVDTVPPTVSTVNSNADTGDGILTQGENTNVNISQLLITFSESVLDPAGDSDPDDVTNPSNYGLILDPAGSATTITIDTIAYNPGNRTAVVNLNSGAPLGPGSYRFTIRGTTTIRDEQANPLDGNGDGTGADDYILNFNILPDRLPDTGFPPSRQSPLPIQKESESFSSLGFRIVIPKLNKDLEIVGVPLQSDEWKVDWLGNSVGYLEGTAFPTWQGNTLLTGHVYLQSGLPGPFININQLSYGDLIQIEAWDLKYIYSVIEKRILDPISLEAYQHSERDIVTLITCRDFDPTSGLYTHRTMIRAVLIYISE